MGGGQGGAWLREISAPHFRTSGTHWACREMWAMLGHCILPAEPQAPIPQSPWRAGGVEKFQVEQ